MSRDTSSSSSLADTICSSLNLEISKTNVDLGRVELLILPNDNDNRFGSEIEGVSDIAKTAFEISALPVEESSKTPHVKSIENPFGKLMKTGGRETRLKNLKILVVIEDDTSIDGAEPFIGNYLRKTLETSEAAHLGDWRIQNNTGFRESAEKNGHSTFDEIKRQVHHQNYWASVYVGPHASVNLRNAIKAGDTQYNGSANSVVVFYETTRDMAAMSQYVIPNLKAVNGLFLGFQGKIIAHLSTALNTSKEMDNSGSMQVAASSLQFQFMDGRPVTSDVLVAPLQVGLIYMVTVTLFSFSLFGEIHSEVSRAGVKWGHLVAYRVLSSIASYFCLSLSFSLLTLAFQVDFSLCFGKAGFLVYWATTFVTMCAAGSMNEIAGMLCIMFCPPLLGFWLLFWVISNIAATFSPIELCPVFFRYTYAMPIHATYEINKVIFFDTYKGSLGREYAIIFIWAVLAIFGVGAIFIPYTSVVELRAADRKRRLEEQIWNDHRQERAKESEDTWSPSNLKAEEDCS